ncbi:hypothetical protein CEXT_198721 [Caerostris extrusa]|uniref:Uncharacterized protein n=1 Tax=Caerostris extrusa TaxID=172846 RepID=A0AAV4TZD1_CAEEX|nr:hypothetical protein CEXT_198721 [Caerostris extrusa]
MGITGQTHFFEETIVQKQRIVDNLPSALLGLCEDENDVSLRCADLSTELMRMQLLQRQVQVHWSPDSTDPL